MSNIAVMDEMERREDERMAKDEAKRRKVA